MELREQGAADSGKVQKRERVVRLGDRLIKDGYITQEQSEKALEYQKAHGGLFGDALVECEMVTRAQLSAFFGKGVKSLSGEKMVQQGLITGDQLTQALNYQEENGGRLGNTVVALGFVSKERVDEFFRQTTVGQKKMLGERLVDQGIITAEQLQNTLELQQRSGGKFGEILVSLRYITQEQLQDTLAADMQIGRTGTKYDFTDAKKVPFEVALKYSAIIINSREDAYIVAVLDQLDVAAVTEIESYLEKPIEQVLATMVEIEDFWEIAYQEESADESVSRLLREQPENSAKSTLSGGQKMVFIGIILLIAAGIFADYRKTLLILNIIGQFIYAFLSLFKFWILFRGQRNRDQLRFTPEEVAAVDERDLPVFTLLIPVYKEASIVPHLVERLEALDYPRHKLDIRVLLEEDDVETQEAFRAYDLPSHYTLLVVPDSGPRTKPKACNYGLIHARGEYSVIYDAEDMPESDQLKKVYLSFQELPEEYVCVQSKLNYFNSKQNIITRWFTHEYSTWFDILLVGLMTFKFPLPLGGTSNHFKTDILREIGAWDPYNVTEDADLGIRLHKLRYKTAVLDSYTFEEANSKLKNWTRQRSRWIKGYMQTWLVHMRSPLKFMKTMGFSGFVGFQAMMLGTPLIPLMNPFFWALMVIWYLFEPSFIQGLFPGALYYIASIQLILGNFLFVYSHLVGTYGVVRDGELKGKMHLDYSIVIAGVLMPVYWLMMTVGAYVALFQLITKPHYWEKTDHGLTEQVTHTPVEVDENQEEEGREQS